MSLSARRAWIEINVLTGGLGEWSVALRKESVDRNIVLMAIKICGLVALRKESVDRNPILRYRAGENGQSLSARRAWIEIVVISGCSADCGCRSPQGERG